MGRDSAFKFPEAPVIAAGGLGGPICAYTSTPLRNALTYASKDASLSTAAILARVFERGLVGGWTGGVYPAIAACPQYLCLGPLFHFYAQFGGNLGGIVLSGLTETAVLYGAETKNAQIAMNARGGMIPEARIQSPFNPIGPGIGVNLARNIFAMSGMRVINEPIAQGISKVTGGSKSGLVIFVSDLVANCCAAGISMPLHMLYMYMAVTPELWDKSQAEQVAAMKRFLKDQYFPNGKFSSVIARDLALRAGYISVPYTMYMMIERAAIKYWPW